MRITASHIVDWAKTHAKQAQQDLPRLIRRLSFDHSFTRQIGFPSGDSTYVPGWDGVTTTDIGSAWVPAGDVRWEVGCDENIESKANRDFKKRTEQTDEKVRTSSTFIFVTPRRWVRKTEWVEKMLAEGKWKDVRAYDADDLEQWLEQTPAVALQFSEELGLTGWGVMSPERYWLNWSQQCAPNILPDAVVGDRTQIQDDLKKKIAAAISQERVAQPVVIRADSVEEAAAFTAISVAEAVGKTLVVTEPEGWRFVEANPQLIVAIAASTEVASKAIVREGLLVMVPHALGDLAAKLSDAEVVLERPDVYEFEKALIALGMEKSDATRFAASSGRSWTVFRRQQAINPSLQNPGWLESNQSRSLSILCLINAWDESKEEDKRIVERISGHTYEEVERDLHELSEQDDSPVLHIGRVWKAKSALELLGVFGGRIPSEQLDRFFEVARDMLSMPDPQLELPDEERWMAQIHRKTRPYSNLLFESVCDSLMKLAARGPEHSGLRALNVEERVSRFVGELLDNADDVRWLSLASYLPTLAEAAPDAFLKAVEDSFKSEEKHVTRLITETGESGLMGRCWHAGLLWALEKLAWSPRRLARVAQVLAQLTRIPMKGNWGNKPSSSLLGLFRSWLPQTAADLTGRIQVLDLLIEREPEAAQNLLEDLLVNGPQSASPASRPDWRDDDAGAGHGVSGQERYEMLIAAKERLLELADQNADRIASLIQNTMLGHREELHGVLPLIKPFLHEENNDCSREKIRASIRRLIHWHSNYDDADQVELNEWLKPIESYYEQLSPKNIVIRHRWLFSSHWVDLPYRTRDDELQGRQDKLTHERYSAVNEIFQLEGVTGLDDLINTCGEPATVGQVLSQVSWDKFSWPDWIIEKGQNFNPDSPINWCLSGYLRALSAEEAAELLQSVVMLGKECGWEQEKFAQFLILAQPNRQTWDILALCGEEALELYWQLVTPNVWIDDEEIEYVLDQMLLVKRPFTALQYCQHSLEKTSPKQLYDLLRLALQGKEEDGPRLNPWHLGKMLERLESSGEIERMDLIHLEFGLFPALGHGYEESAKILYESITSESELFNELIRFGYKPKHGERAEPNEASKAAARTSWRILRSCKRIPGTQHDGTVNERAMLEFVDAVLAQGRTDDRLTMCEQTLGEIFAHCRSDEDGTWPPRFISKLLDRADLEEMRIGFAIGAHNKRGITSRSPGEGGGQERDLAQYYREQTEKIQHIFPNVSSMLDSIARSYESHAKREDDEAGLRREGF